MNEIFQLSEEELLQRLEFDLEIISDGSTDDDMDFTTDLELREREAKIDDISDWLEFNELSNNIDVLFNKNVQSFSDSSFKNIGIPFLYEDKIVNVDLEDNVEYNHRNQSLNTKNDSISSIESVGNCFNNAFSVDEMKENFEAKLDIVIYKEIQLLMEEILESLELSSPILITNYKRGVHFDSITLPLREKDTFHGSNLPQIILNEEDIYSDLYLEDTTIDKRIMESNEHNETFLIHNQNDDEKWRESTALLERNCQEFYQLNDENVQQFVDDDFNRRNERKKRMEMEKRKLICFKSSIIIQAIFRRFIARKKFLPLRDYERCLRQKHKEELERLAAIELQQKQEALENLRKEEAKIADLKRQEQELQKLKMKMEKERLLMAMEDLVSFKIREERMKMDYENKQMAEEELLSVMLQHMIPHKKDKSEGLSVTCKDTYDERNEFDSVVRIEEDLNDYSSFIISVEDDDDMNDANPYVWDPIPFIRRNQYEGQSSTVYPKEADNQKHYTRHLMNQYELEGIHREYINKNMENIRMQYQFQSSQSAIVQVNQSKPSRVSYDLLSCLHSWLHWKSEHHIIIQQQESQSIKLLNDISLDKSNISIISNESLEGSEIKLLKDVGLYGSNTITTTRIELNVENLKSISFLKSFHNLLQLEINVNNLITLVGLEPMIQLEELSVKDNALYSIESLRNHMRLKHLKFDSNKLTDLSPLDGIHSLLTLSASTNLLESIPEIRCERLERLELYHNHIFIICDQSFQGLKNLTYLDLGRNKIEYVSGDGLNSCQLLQTIILSQNKLTRLPTPLYLPHLRNLWLGGNQLNDLNDWIHYLTTPSTADDSIKELMPIFLPSLEKLYLQDNHIQHIPENFLMAMPQLMYFDISFNRIQSIGDLKGLCIGSHGSLQSLLLQDNPLTSIPQLPSLPEHQESVINVEQRAAAFYNNEILELWLRYACPKLKSYCGNHFSTDMNETIPACPESSVSSTEVTSTNNFLSMNINQSQKSSDAHTNHIKEHTKDSLRYYKATGRWKQPTDMALKKATTHLTYDEMLYRIRSASSALIYALSSCPSSASPSPTGIAQHILLYLQKNHDRIHSHSIQSSPLVLELLHQFKNMIMEQNAMRYEEKKFKSNETVQYDDVSNAESFRNLLIQQSERLERWTSHHYDACTRALMHHYIYSKRLRQERNDDKNIITMNPGHINDMNQLYWDDKIIRIQRSYRGYRIRKKIKYLFDSIRYVDDELDDILDMNHTVGDDHYDQLDLDFNLAEYDDYFKPITLDEKYSSSLREATSAIAASVIQPVGTIAYGDHKRLYRRPSSSQLKENSIMYDDDKSIQSETLPSTLPLSSLPHNSKDNILLSNPIPAWDSARHDYHQDSDHKVHQNLSRQTSSSSRPLTSVTITSDITMSSQGSRGSDIPHSYEYQSYQQSHDHNNDDISIADSKLSTDSTQKKASKLSSIANEWGISDPKLMNAILKRNRRLKSFEEAKEIREKEKDPEERFRRFLKATGAVGTGNQSSQYRSGNSSTTISGSFGGRPRINRGGRGRGGRTAVIPPAWMLGSDELGESKN